VGGGCSKSEAAAVCGGAANLRQQHDGCSESEAAGAASHAAGMRPTRMVPLGNRLQTKRFVV
jgi:hypothetical protein